MQILPLADACALVVMSPEHRAAPVGAGAWKVGWGGRSRKSGTPCISAIIRRKVDTKSPARGGLGAGLFEIVLGGLDGSHLHGREGEPARPGEV